MSQLDTKQINRIARNVATANLTSGSVKSVFSRPTVDSEGRDAVRITITLMPGTTAGVKGDAALNTVVEIEDKLRSAGDLRFPVVEFKEPGKRGGHP